MRLVLIALLMFFFSFNVEAEIRLGVSNATTGPTKELGVDLNWGAELYFEEINQNGGIAGQLIKLLKIDDGYEPDQTVMNTKALLSQKVIGLFNYVGTPTTSAIMNILARQETPLITPFTGADFLRVHQNKVFNIRASYEQEAYAQVSYLANTMGLKNIALFIQADEFGLALERYHLEALSSLGIEPVATVRYKRNTADITKAANKLMHKKVEAVLYVGTFRPLLSFIQYSQPKGFSPVYMTSSFVSSYRLFERLTPPSHVVVTEVVPDPNQCPSAICEKFRKLAKERGEDKLNRVQFEGFLNAIYVANALQHCKQRQATIDYKCLIDGLTETRAEQFLRRGGPQSTEGQLYFSEFKMQ